MIVTLMDATSVTTLAPSDLPAKLPTTGFFWLDIEDAPPMTLDMAAKALGLDSATAEWFLRFNQRARFTLARQDMRVSTWAGGDDGQPVEVHLLTAREGLLTAHTGARDAFAQVRATVDDMRSAVNGQRLLAALLVLNELLSSFNPSLEGVDGWLNNMQNVIAIDARPAQLAQLTAMRKYLGALQRACLPLRDDAAAFVSAVPALRGVQEHDIDGFRSYSERVADLVEQLDDYRQRTTEAIEGYRAHVAERQTRLINRLTMISGTMLPITVTTSFFGMNFNWLIAQIGTRTAFFLWGLGFNAVMLTMMILLFGRRGWLSGRGGESLEDLENAQADVQRVVSRPPPTSEIPAPST